MRAVDGNGESIPFSLRVVAYNEQLKQGGQVLDFERAVLTQTGKKSPKTNRIIEPILDHEKLLKNPNHGKNLTLNITILPSKNIRTIHVPLITRINAERVF